MKVTRYVVILKAKETLFWGGQRWTNDLSQAALHYSRQEAVQVRDGLKMWQGLRVGKVSATIEETNA